MMKLRVGSKFHGYFTLRVEVSMGWIINGLKCIWFEVYMG